MKKDKLRSDLQSVVDSFEDSQLNLASGAGRQILVNSLMAKLTEPEIGSTCVFTNNDVINDCYITVEFGFGAVKDGLSYKFGPVVEEVGESVLNLLQSKLPTDVNIKQFEHNDMEELFNQ